MNVGAFIADIETSGFSLAILDGNLAVAPASQLNTEQREFIRNHKSELVRTLVERGRTQMPISTVRRRKVTLSFTLHEQNGHPSRPARGCLIDPSGMESALHCLQRTYGERLATIENMPADEFIRRTLGKSS